MKFIYGKGLCRGISFGNAYFMPSESDTVVTHNKITDIPSEIGRFIDAQRKAEKQLVSLADNARSQGNNDGADIFELHHDLITDPDFEDAVKGKIADGINAEFAVSASGKEFADIFASMDDDYMRERSTDIADVADRLCRILSGCNLAAPVLNDNSVIIADTLSPSALMRLDTKKISAVLLGRGSDCDHTKILLGTMGIPQIIRIGDGLNEIAFGESVIVDSESGTIVVSPDEKTISEYKTKQEIYRQKSASIFALKGHETVTKNGQKMSLLCNISNYVQADSVVENDGEGIGLFRSEFLYMDRPTLPTEEEQFIAYKNVLKKMGNRPVVIRTADIGSDKKPDCINLEDEENPALGLRGIRFSLEHEDIFRAQLRALLRASAYGNLSIMLPMIVNSFEIERTKEIIAQIKESLIHDGILFDVNVKLGIMIETPATALSSDELAQKVDFFSIGTNDLTQYTLAVDRTDGNLEKYASPHHSSVLKLISLTAENAHKNGIPVCICGELASDISLLDFFIENKIDSLSVSPDMILKLRGEIRSK